MPTKRSWSIRSAATCTSPRTAAHRMDWSIASRDRSQTYGALRNGGTLTAMSCSLRGTHVPDLSVFSTPGTSLDVEWVSVLDPQAQAVSIRRQFDNAQITRSRKFEGAWWGDATGNGEGSNSGHGRGNRKAEKAHIVCSFARLSDGSLAEHDGQVWGYDPDDQTLTLELYLPVNPNHRRTSRRARQHLRVTVRRVLPRRGRRRRPTPAGSRHEWHGQTVRPQPPQHIGVHRRGLRSRRQGGVRQRDRTKGSASPSPGRSTSSHDVTSGDRRSLVRFHRIFRNFRRSARG